jgi:hypothetical protein
VDVTTREDLASVHEKLDRILKFQAELQPFLPLLVRAAEFLDNPASRFKAAMARRGKKDT